MRTGRCVGRSVVFLLVFFLFLLLSSSSAAKPRFFAFAALRKSTSSRFCGFAQKQVFRFCGFAQKHVFTLLRFYAKASDPARSRGAATAQDHRKESNDEVRADLLQRLKLRTTSPQFDGRGIAEVQDEVVRVSPGALGRRQVRDLGRWETSLFQAGEWATFPRTGTC